MAFVVIEVNRNLNFCARTGWEVVSGLKLVVKVKGYQMLLAVPCAILGFLLYLRCRNPPTWLWGRPKPPKKRQ